MADSLEQEIQGLRALLHTDRDPEGRAFVPLADAYRRAKDLDRALEVVSIGLERHPDLASAYVVEAWVHQDRGDADGATAAWEQVLRLDADNVEALKGLGCLMAAAGSVEKAAPLIEKARALDPEQPDLRELIAQMAPTVEEPPRQEAATPAPVTEVEVVPPPAADVEASAPPAVEITAPPAPVLVTRPPVTTPHPPVSAASLEKEAAEDGEELATELPATRTLAELYARQGLVEPAIDVYQRLVDASPDDAGLRRRLAELRSAAAPPPRPQHPGGVHDEDIETLARVMGAPAPVEPSISPFAWGPEEASTEAVADGSGLVSDYFRRLLEWEPVERTEFAGSAAVAAAASRAAAQVETPRVVPVETLAGKPLVSIESLAPGVVVPIASLAPSVVVPVAQLAPYAIPIEALAPRRGPAASSSRS